MAVIPYTITPNPDACTFVIKWLAVTEADTCAAVNLPGYPDRSVQVTGTFGSATVLIQGSNDASTYATLNDPANEALSFTAAGLKGIMEAPAYIKPSISGGTSQSLNIYINMVGAH